MNNISEITIGEYNYKRQNLHKPGEDWAQRKIGEVRIRKYLSHQYMRKQIIQLLLDEIL